MPKNELAMIFFVTFPSQEEAEKLIIQMLESNLIACGNIIKSIQSIYRWKGKIENETEYLAILKTKKSLSAQLIEFIEKYHSYETAECIGFEIDKISGKYHRWLIENTKFKK